MEPKLLRPVSFLSSPAHQILSLVPRWQRGRWRPSLVALDAHRVPDSEAGLRVERVCPAPRTGTGTGAVPPRVHAARLGRCARIRALAADSQGVSTAASAHRNAPGEGCRAGIQNGRHPPGLEGRRPYQVRVLSIRGRTSIDVRHTQRRMPLPTRYGASLLAPA